MEIYPDCDILSIDNYSARLDYRNKNKNVRHIMCNTNKKGERQNSLAQISKAHELGWKPTIDILDYIKSWVKNQSEIV
jgi:nucleoside-diphosphate-sugar epimerase